MSSVKTLINYIKTIQIPLVWKINDVTITLTVMQGCLQVRTDSKVPHCEELILPEDFSLILVAEFISRSTITGVTDKKVFVSGQAEVFEKILAISNLPKNYNKQAVWLIHQFEQGNKLPLVDRAQEIAGDIFNTAGGDIEDNHLVIDYYRNNIDAEVLNKALRLAQELRITVAHMSQIRVGMYLDQTSL